MNLFALSGLFIFITTILLSFFIFIKANKRIHFLWIFFSLTVSLWGIGVYKIGLEADSAIATVWWRIAYTGVIFIPTLYLHFIFEFINKIQKKILWFFYLCSSSFLILNIGSEIFINKVKLVFNKFYYISNPEFFYNLFVFYFFATVAYAVYLLMNELKFSDSYYRNQIRYFLIATFVGYCGGLFAFLPVYDIYVYPVLNFLVALFPLIIAYSVFKYRMMDVRAAAQSGLIYAVLLAMVIGFYLALLFFLDLFFQQMQELEAMLAGVITTLIGIWGTPVIEKYFRKKTDKLFFKDGYDYSTAIYDLSKILNRNIDINILLHEANKELRKIFKVSLLRFVLLKDGVTIDENGDYRKSLLEIPKNVIKNIEDERVGIINKQEVERRLSQAQKNKQSEIIQTLEFPSMVFKKFDVEIIVPIYLEKSLIALLLLGKKKSGDMYTHEDNRLLKTFSYQAGVAIDKARLFEEVKNYSDELEKKVIRRTAKIQGLQEEQRQMIHEMAHGLQTPLTILRSEITELSTDPKYSKKIESLEKSIDKVSGLIYKMLRLAKLESCTNNESFQKINLSELLFDLAESFQIICAEKKIKIENDIEKNIFLTGSQSEIEELITNLVSNSVKYIGDRDDKKISIKLTREKKSVIIKISDNGIGIDKNDQKMLFQRFYRAQSAKSSSIKGTGLGLLISKKIVERHKGAIDIESKIGQGTQVTINFQI